MKQKLTMIFAIIMMCSLGVAATYTLKLRTDYGDGSVGFTNTDIIFGIDTNIQVLVPGGATNTFVISNGLVRAIN